MAPPGRPAANGQHNDDYAVARRPRDAGVLVQQNGRPYSSYGELTAYQRQAMDPAALAQASAEKEKHSNTPKAHQNAEAIKRYNLKEKGKYGKVLQGKHSAAVDQIHQNDLHNIEKVTELPQTDENGEALMANNMAVAKGDKSSSYITQQVNLRGKYSRAHKTGTRPQSGLGPRPSSNNSDLCTSFDPMRDRHMWTMWRTAVTGRVVDEVLRLERIKNERGPEALATADPDNPSIYGRALVATPLKQFIRFENDESRAAADMSRLGQGSLHSSQFVYYGLPRVQVQQARHEISYRQPEL